MLLFTPKSFSSIFLFLHQFYTPSNYTYNFDSFSVFATFHWPKRTLLGAYWVRAEWNQQLLNDYTHNTDVDYKEKAKIKARTYYNKYIVLTCKGTWYMDCVKAKNTATQTQLHVFDKTSEN